MVQRDQIPKEVNDIEQYKLIREAINASQPAYPETPYGATKTAELNVQFAVDPSYGLTRERYAWFSDGTFFDSSNFDTSGSRIDVETNATVDSSARIRSAYPGQYVSHTIAEPGLGAELRTQDLEYDVDGHVSLTHGEISLEVSSIETSTGTGINAHGISYEEDGVYHQVRVDGSDVAKVPQQKWNIDPLDGTGPSGFTLTPDDGYVYQFIYSWYGEGQMVLAIQDPGNGILPVNAYTPSGAANPPVTSPNLPVQVIVQNQGTADTLGLTVGGMQFATHGKEQEGQTTRTTEEGRHTSSSFISDNIVLDEEAVDPYSTTHAPLVAAKRKADREVEKGLKFEIGDVLANVNSDVYLFIFDEFNVPTSGLDGSFTEVTSRNSTAIDESKILTNTTATTYTPTTDSVLRGFSYVPSSKNDPAIIIAGDTTARVPLRATSVITAALAPGENNTGANPALVEFKEGF